LAGLRGVAAYSVLLAHMIDSDFPADHAHAFAVGLSHFVMSLFFVLSGFVIHYNYGRMLNTASGLTQVFINLFTSAIFCPNRSVRGRSPSRSNFV
jgi:peptidoglycan/LPS O-acetylase OafA/YrhL